ncbi:MAG TPA: GDYXXLXY domain-containing protein [Bauldia sp.]|nr:GDYXXLXY domain-containing protein [Bauldia sp.]
MNRMKILGFAGAFVLQAAMLAWMVGDRALLLAGGREVRLAVVPVDPRDLLRGDYIVLTYPIDRLNESALAGDKGFARGDTVYVTLVPDGPDFVASGLWRAPPSGDGVVLRGVVRSSFAEKAGCATPCISYSVDYGIGRFFVPEGEGKALEALRNDQRLSVDIAVGSDGRAAIKRLLVDGTVRYSESLL